MKLVVPERNTGHYLTLSYCWGRSKPYLTTTSKVLASMESIAIDSLPQTLKDAISSTRMLGCRYIWIDALCIIQDDPEDWQREAANMCSMYENAVLSLSILDAEGCNNGFLHSMPLAEDIDLNGSTISIGLGRSGQEPCSLRSRSLCTGNQGLDIARAHYSSSGTALRS